MLLKIKKNLLSVIILVVAVGFAVFLIFYQKNKPSADLNAFAECLAEKKVVMYGAYWCPHCQNEKKAFGDSFRFVPYVECTKEVQECIAAGINRYPTWIFADGRRFEGELGLRKLSLESGCPLLNKYE